MRRIICRFEDGPAFLTSLNRRMFGDPRLTFLADFPLRSNELVRVTIVIEDSGESHDLHMHLDESRPTIADSGRGVCWHYRATPVSEDAPWLEMLATKHATARRMTK